MRSLLTTELKQVSGGKSSGKPPAKSNSHNHQGRGNKDNEHSQGEAHRTDHNRKRKKGG